MLLGEDMRTWSRFYWDVKRSDLTGPLMAAKNRSHMPLRKAMRE